MSLFRRKHRDMQGHQQDASDRMKGSESVDNRNSPERDAVGKERSHEIMEQWTDVPIGKQKSDGSGERR